MVKNLSMIITVSAFVLTGCQTMQTTAQTQDSPAMALPQSKIDHLSQLESRVANLETKMDAATPSLQKIDMMERHFRSLSFELDKISAAYNINEPKKIVPATPKMEKTIIQPVAKPKTEKAQSKPIINSAVAAVTSVRVGEKKGEVTRIVLDTTQPAEMKYDIDNGEHILIIDLPGNQWNATRQMTLKSSPMVKSFTATSDESGAHLILQLKQIAKVATTARLTPSGVYGHRVYLDLVPAK